MIKVNSREIIFDTFPNSEIRLALKHLLISDNKMANIFFKWENDSDFMKLMYLKRELNRYCHRIDLIIAYMPYSRMDRSEGEFAFTLKWVCDFINDLEFDSVKVMEAHSDVTCALLDNSWNQIVVKDLFDSIGYSDTQEIVIYFPDGGAYKKYEKFFSGTYDIFFGNKIRDFSTGKIIKLDIVGDNIPENCHVVMIDDLCSYGGTFVMAAERIMQEFKPCQIDLVVTHCETSIVDGRIFKDSHISKVYTTDSIITKDYDSIDKLNIHPLELYL